MYKFGLAIILLIMLMSRVGYGAGYTFTELETDAVGEQVQGFKANCFDSYGVTSTEVYDGSGSTAFGSASFYCLGLSGLAKIDCGNASGTFTVRLYGLVGSTTTPSAFATLNYGSNTSNYVPIMESPLLVKHGISVQMVSGTGVISISEIWKK